MADYVQASLESMIPELKKLMKKKIFKENEVKAIIKQRRNYEYNLQSGVSGITDYYRYLNYEITLYKLTQTRIKLKSKKIKKSKYLGLGRITRIFEKAVKRYHANRQLWVDYFNFCEESKLSKTLSGAFARALQYHPLEESFWIRAAFWEYKKNHNINAARVLLQRALRVIKTSKNLWLKYCKLELDYRKKIKDRIQLLGINAENVLENTNENRKIQLPDEEDVDKEEIAVEETAFSNAFLEGTIPFFIFQTAISKIPGDYQFQIDFIKLFKQYDDTEKLVEKILESIQLNFPDNVKCQAILAVLPLSSLSRPLDDSPESFEAIKQCENLFHDYLQNTSDRNAFFIEISNFYQNMMALCVRDDQLKMKEYLMENALQFYSSSLDQKIINEKIIDHWSDIYLLKGDSESALQLAEKFTSIYPQSADIWKFFVHLKLKLHLLSPPSDNQEQKKFEANIFQIYERAFGQVKEVNQLLSLWLSFFEFSIKTDFKSASFLSFFRKAVVSLFSSNLAKDQFVSYILSLAFSIFDIEFVRALYAIAFEFPPLSIPLHQKIIDFERSQFVVDAQRVRSLFDKLISLPGKDLNDPKIWLHYLQFEMSQNNFEKVNHVNWKAQKYLSEANQKVLEEQYKTLL